MSTLKCLRTDVAKIVFHANESLVSFQSITPEELSILVKRSGLKSTWFGWLETNYFVKGDQVVVFELRAEAPMNRNSAGVGAAMGEVLLHPDAFSHLVKHPVSELAQKESTRPRGVYFDKIGIDLYQIYPCEKYENQYMDMATLREEVNPADLDWRLYFNSDEGIGAGVVLGKEIPFTSKAAFANLNKTFLHLGEIEEYICYRNSFLANWIKGKETPKPEPVYVQLDSPDVMYSLEEVLEIISVLRPDLNTESNIVKKLLKK